MLAGKIIFLLLMEFVCHVIKLARVVMELMIHNVLVVKLTIIFKMDNVNMEFKLRNALFKQ